MMVTRGASARTCSPLRELLNDVQRREALEGLFHVLEAFDRPRERDLVSPHLRPQPPRVERQPGEHRDHAGERDGERNRHTWSIVSRTQLLASAAAPAASTSTVGPSASSRGRVRSWMRAGCSGIHTVSRAQGINSASTSVRRGEARVSSTSASSRRENPSASRRLAAPSRRSHTQRVGDDREDQVQRAPRQHLGRERAVQDHFERRPPATPPAGGRRSRRGPERRRRVVGRGHRHRLLGREPGRQLVPHPLESLSFRLHLELGRHCQQRRDAVTEADHRDDQRQLRGLLLAEADLAHPLPRLRLGRGLDRARLRQKCTSSRSRGSASTSCTLRSMRSIISSENPIIFIRTRAEP